MLHLLSSPVFLDRGWSSSTMAVSAGFIYWTANDNLYKGKLGVWKIESDPIKPLGGWNGRKIAVDGGSIYWTASDNKLYHAKLNAEPLDGQERDPGGWKGVGIAVSDGFIYWTASDNLYKADLKDIKLRSVPVAHGRWDGAEIAVADHDLYWTTGGNLYTAELTEPLGARTLLAVGGWSGPIATSSFFVFYTSAGDLYKSMPSHKPLQRIAFGSCAAHWNPTPIWNRIADKDPELFLLIGDTIYADIPAEDRQLIDTNPPLYLQRMCDKYKQVADRIEYRLLQNTSLISSTWDDHDYGLDDAYSEFQLKDDSQQIFLDFFGVPKHSPLRMQKGIYQAQVFGPSGQRVQIILLDVRYHGDTQTQKLLGEDQWRWLAEQLRKPAQIRLIASSIQVIDDSHKVSGWHQFPAERQRLYELIRDTMSAGVILLSGDVHFAELMKMEPGIVRYPLYDLTSSGLNNASTVLLPEENDARRQFIVGKEMNNFGQIEITWRRDPGIRLVIYNEAGVAAAEHTIHLSELQPPRKAKKR